MVRLKTRRCDTPEKSRVVPAALQGDNRLPGNADFFRQVLLRKTILFPQ